MNNHRRGNRLPARMRLVRTRDFDAVYQARVRAVAGPLVVWAAPNDVGHPRLGLAVSRRVGSAPVRNRIKRLVRESFRLLQHELSERMGGYDLVVSVRPHRPAAQAQYQRALNKAIEALERSWCSRQDKTHEKG